MTDRRTVAGRHEHVAAILAVAMLASMGGAVAQSKTPMNPPGQMTANLDALAAEPYASGDVETTVASVGAGRTKVRQLLGFETGPDGKPMSFQYDGKPVKELPRRDAESADAVYVQDKGVTEGHWCCRFTATAGQPWAATIIDDPEVIKDWRDFDYFAMDLYTDDDHPYPIGFELWDHDSSNYVTRCSVSATTHPGHQTLLFKINRLKRNGKEGRQWGELEPKDKIDLNNLKFIKLYTTPRKDRPTMFWIDNLRLMQEDAAVPKMKVTLPKAAVGAYDFCKAAVALPGFKVVTIQTAFTEETGFGFTSTDGLKDIGQGWPDLLTGTAVAGANNKTIEFKTKLPDGDYLVWLAAGPIITDEADAPYLLKLGDKVLYEDTPSRDQKDGEKYLHRFLWTQYSERPHALWLDYISRMYPVYRETVKVSGGTLTVDACNFFVSGMIVLPADKNEDFARIAARIEKARVDMYEGSLYVPAQKKAAAGAGDGDYLVYAPDAGRDVMPSSEPTDAERKQTRLSARAAPGQNVFLQLAMMPFKDLGACELKLADLNGPGGAKLGTGNVLGHFKNYRQAGRSQQEMILLPTLAFNGEKGVTQSLWLWLTVPSDAKPGKYSGAFTFVPSTGKSTEVPVEIDILPIKLKEVLPLSLGMYYSGRGGLSPKGDEYKNVIRDQLKWMRKIGLTATALHANSIVVGLAGDDQVNMRFESGFTGLIKEAGLGRDPMQMQMSGQLGIGRAIGRALLGGAAVDQNPGCEFGNAKFKGYQLNALRQWKKYLDTLQIPYATEIVDEPREVPNPWNRNFEHSCLYGDMMKEAGFAHRFITPMGDHGTTSGGKTLDYTDLVDHTDIISIHAGPGSKGMQERTLKSGKILWYYNSGMSRYMWGFQPWSVGVAGRWEWHWCWSEGSGMNGYPGEDWYNPFTGRDGDACNAPVGKYPGGFLYKSVFLTAADGITDWTYLCSLTDAVQKNRDAKTKPEVVAKAENLLKQINAAVPPIPHGPDDQKAIDQVDAWREAIGKLLVDLQ